MSNKMANATKTGFPIAFVPVDQTTAVIASWVASNTSTIWSPGASAITTFSLVGDNAGAKDNYPSKSVMVHTIGFFLQTGYQLLDLAGPLDAFQAANVAAARTLYRTDVLSRRGGRVVGSGGVVITTAPSHEALLGTLMVIGGDLARMRCPDEVATVRRLAKNVSRLAHLIHAVEAGLLV